MAAVYFWIALGSALGGVARHWTGDVAARWLGIGFPWGTLFVNIIGSFIIGFVFTLTGPQGRIEAGTSVKAFVMVGLCGGYTTFSAFSLQTLALMQDGAWLRAGANAIGSVALCLAAVWLGALAGLAIGQPK